MFAKSTIIANTPLSDHYRSMHTMSTALGVITTRLLQEQEKELGAPDAHRGSFKLRNSEKAPWSTRAGERPHIVLNLMQAPQQAAPAFTPEAAIVCAVIVRTIKGQRCVLLGRYAAEHPLPYLRGCLSTPGGKLNDGEDPCHGAFREIGEETGSTDGLRAVLLETATVTRFHGGRPFKSPVSFVLLEADAWYTPATTEPDKIKDWHWYDVRHTIPDLTPLTIAALARFGIR